MSQEKRFSSYKPYGNLLEKYGRNKKVTSTAVVPFAGAAAPAKLEKESRAIVSSGGVSSVIGKEIKDGQKTDREVFINQKDRLEGMYIIGRTGAGKSAFIENAVLQDIENNLGVFLIDPDGELINNVLRRMSKRLEDVVLIDLNSDNYVAPLNLFYCKDIANFKERHSTVSSFMHVLRSFYSVNPKTPDMNHYFTNIAKTLMYNPQNTLLDIQCLLDDDAFRKRLVANVPDETVRGFWDVHYAKHQRGTERDKAINFVVNKLLEFTSDVMLPWFASPGKGLSFRELADDQKLVFIKLKPEWVNSSELMGNIIIAYLLDAAYSRSDITDIDDRQQVNVYVDEFQDIASFDFAKLFTRGRKYKFGITVANQVRAMIDDIIKATCDQAAHIVVFPVSPPDAKELANVFNCAARDGEIRYEAVEMPVEEPIQYMLNHGVHPLPGVRQFMNKFGKKLVEDAKYEEELERDHRHEVQNLQRDIASMASHWTVPVIKVTDTSRLVLENLNNLFYEAAMCGRRKESTDGIFIDVPLLVGTLLGSGNLSMPLGLESVVDRGKKVEELKERGKAIHLSSDREIMLLREEKKRTEKEYRDFLKEYLVSEVDGFLESLRIVEYNSLYYIPSACLQYYNLCADYTVFLHDDSRPFLKGSPFSDRELAGRGFNPYNEDSPSFSSFSDALAFYRHCFRKLWFPVTFLSDNVYGWESESVAARFSKLVYRSISYGHRCDSGFDYFLYPATVWRPITVKGHMLYTDALLEREVRNRFTACKEPVFGGDITIQAALYDDRFRNGDDYYNFFTLHTLVKQSDREAVYQYLADIKGIDEEIRALQERNEWVVKQRIEYMEDEINRIEGLQEQIDRYNAVATDFERELRVILRELAVAPVEADTGVTREVPTVIPASEVERVVVEEIKELRKFTARVKVPSGEYVINTIPPTKGIGKEALQERIAGIQERNLAAGYLRLRSDVEREILERQQSPQKQEMAAAVIPTSEKKPARAAGAVPPPATRRLQGKIGE